MLCLLNITFLPQVFRPFFPPSASVPSMPMVLFLMAQHALKMRGGFWHLNVLVWSYFISGVTQNSGEQGSALIAGLYKV